MTDITDLQKVLVALARIEEQIKGIREDIDQLNGFRDWAVRLVIGAVILGLVGMLWAQGGTSA